MGGGGGGGGQSTLLVGMEGCYFPEEGGCWQWGLLGGMGRGLLMGGWVRGRWTSRRRIDGGIHACMRLMGRGLRKLAYRSEDRRVFEARAADCR